MSSTLHLEGVVVGEDLNSPTDLAGVVEAQGPDLPTVAKEAEEVEELKSLAILRVSTSLHGHHHWIVVDFF